MTFPKYRLQFCFCIFFLSLLTTFSYGNDTKQALAIVAPRLVRIDTIGGHEKVGDEFANDGTSTGVLLDRQGFVLTSAFHFLHDPASILLRFSDGSKKVARRVATDRNRMLTLLKVENLDAAFIPETLDVRAKESIRIGEACLVLGVALAQDEPNLSIGVVSGKDRIWDKAIQTDAAVGPNNYGGPLVDFEGKLIGLAVPLSMMSTELTAGSETYDAGVGLAVPFEDIVSTVLPNLKKERDLEPGALGIEFKENRIFVGRAIVDKVVPGLPAAESGLKEGDLITAIDGKPMTSALQVCMNLRKRYVAEKIGLTFLRNEKEQTVELTTVPYPRQDKDRPAIVPGQLVD